MTVASLVLALVPCAPVQEDAPERWRLGEIEVSTSDIYSEADAERYFLARLVDATHWTTRESVVRREIWLETGDTVTEDDAAEVERNLRATGLFATVDVELRPAEEAGVADLVVTTRDRISISGGASGSFVGNIGRLRASLGERNLLGTGDEIGVGFAENSEDEFRGAFSYLDRHVAGSWVEGSVEVGRTEEGDFWGVGLHRPFKHLRDPRSWSVDVGSAVTEVDYFDAGDTVAEVDQDAVSFTASHSWRSGPRDELTTYGVRVRHDDRSFGDATGPEAGRIDVPGDTVRTFAGASLGLELVTRYDEVRRLDTLGFVQDLTLGAGFELLAGVERYDEDGVGARHEPTLGIDAHFAAPAGDRRYVTGTVEGVGRSHAGELQGWRASLRLHAFDLRRDHHTFAARLAFDEAFEGEGLPIEFTLGEGAGLRGYPSREFSGGRIVRLNLEDRIDFGGKLGPFELGAVAFVDAGWVEERGEGFGRPLRSIGVGLRIGSDELMGPRVARIDFAVPLDDVDGRDFDPLLSFSLGQVFGFR